MENLYGRFELDNQDVRQIEAATITAETLTNFATKLNSFVEAKLKEPISTEISDYLTHQEMRALKRFWGWMFDS